jgi:ribose transport system substrate-binding protein
VCIVSSIRRLRPSAALLLLAVASVALVVAGCGGGGSSSSSSTTGEAPSANSGSGGSGGGEATTVATGSAQEGLEAAEAIADPIRKPPNQNLPITKLPSIPSDMRIDFIKCGLPICQVYVGPMEEAAKALGISLKVVDAGNSSTQQTQAWDQAVSDEPSAVIESGFQLSLFQKQLGELKAKGIPVISNGDVGEGVTYNIEPPSTFKKIGEREAAYVIAESEGKAHVLLVTTPEVPLVTWIIEGQEKTYKEDCPECTVESMQVQLEDIGRTIPSEVVSQMQTHPENDWIALGFGDMVAGLPEALKGAGISGTHIISGAGSKINWGYIQEEAQQMDLAEDLGLLGWWMIDRSVRVVAGEKPPLPPLLQEYLTKENLNFNLNEGWVAVPGYQKQFEEKWEAQ